MPLTAPDGYRVIDRQGPVRGPSDVDLVVLLIHSGLDAGPPLLLHRAVRGDRDVAPGRPQFRTWAKAA